MVKKDKVAYSKILKAFDKNDKKTSLTLRKILNEYPFFQSASAYYLKTLKAQKKESFEELLPKTAILTYNRSILRKWIFEKNEYSIDENLPIIEKYTFLDWFDQINESKSSLNSKIDIIDNFIKNSPKISIDKKYIPTSEFKIDTNIKDDLITETLAKIYISQEKYNKAIKAYKILSLKYPKKSSFFADQIEKIKNLKKNNN
tara:strand:+ start:1366 stop:1971 length:606 start_codon:yes stop_codon:yes gene_type:complete